MPYQNPEKFRDFIFKNSGIGIRVRSREPGIFQDPAGHCRVVVYMAILTQILQARVESHVLARVIMHVHDYYLKTCILDSLRP